MDVGMREGVEVVGGGGLSGHYLLALTSSLTFVFIVGPCLPRRGAWHLPDL